MSAPPCTICVTGATSYVAGPIVARLLAAGHTVHGTCRDPSSGPTTSALRALPGAASRLRLFAADLLLPGSFDSPVAGCDFVIHTASPFALGVGPRDAARKLVEPAVMGVENVLAAVERTPSVRRVVLTSSIAATYSRRTDHGVDRPIDESCWNTTASEAFLAYSYSKTLAERRAWELAGQQDRWRLVAVNPGLVLGPTVGSHHAASQSVSLLRCMLRGLFFPAAPRIGVAYVDVRDVAAAHCRAMLEPRASGRYLAVADSSTLRRMTAALASLYPGGSVRRPLLAAPRWVVWLLAPLFGFGRDVVLASWGAAPRFDTGRAASDLGLSAWVPLEESLYDMVEDLAENGVVRHPLKGRKPRGDGGGVGAGGAG
ncbi:Tetraketide alpha-pyrone reductase 1, partial [Tetrabaena socialis]